jgi:Rps23 Pro-64 3,4-dihydroxylase Tpa1-like proline 4-hydroxylase
MNAELHKKLITDGYLSFDLDNETKEKLKPIANILKKLEFREAVHTDCGETGYTKDTEFEILEELKKEYAPLKKWQFWYQHNTINTIVSNDEYTILKTLFSNILCDVYPTEWLELDNIISNIECTMYNKLCYIKKHKDGNDGNRICNILIYLNDDYIEGMGGEIVINNEKINPELGRVAILDFSTINPTHSVNEVLDDNFRRIALLVGINKRN